MAATESEIAAQLIERLLADPAFRDRFRRDPAVACREAGLESLAEEMRLGGGKAMHTLDIRESRSSLAGVMMAAAMEGMGVYEFSKHVVPHIEDLSGSLGDVLSRVNLPALPGGGAMAGAPETSAAPTEPAGATNGVAAPAAQPAAPAPAAAEEAAAPEAAAASSPKAPAAPELVDGDEEEQPDGEGPRSGVPAVSELPDGPVRTEPAEGGPEAGDDDVARPAAQPAAPGVEAPAAGRPPIDPDQFGQDGSGGSADAEALALLENKNVVLDDVGVADIKAGRIDPRIVGVLTKLSQEHKITVSCMCSDHSKFTTGGSISNHAYGRGLDIAAIDGEIVSPGSALAREVASELSDLDPAIRPDEIGSPFAISGPGYFTDAAHMNHVHVGFKQQITPDYQLPAGLRAGGAAPAAAGTPGADPVVDAGALGPGGSPLGAAALRVAQTQRGVREIGTNTGPQVDRYLEAAAVPPGNPWCASFLAWSLQQAGHKMPGGGWAAVATWVRNAEQGSNGLKLVSAEEARPGDIAAYDWGGENDFGADGHIGFLASGVKDGEFTALEGNNADAVNVVPRQLGGGANVVFIRVEGDAPAGAAPIDPGQAAATPAAPAAAAAGAPPAAPVDPERASGLFAAVAQPAELASVEPDAAKAGGSQLFLQAVAADRQPATPAAAAPAEAPAVELPEVQGYPGDDAPREQLAAWMAAQAKKRDLPPQLPVMAALVESGLKNLNFGDADSVGFFQMRMSVWNEQYPGYADDPQKQVDWFLDQAEAVKQQRIARGQPVDDPSQFGEWIADIERPAEQYRGRYQLQLDQANTLLKNATPAEAPEGPAPAAPDVAAAPADEAAELAPPAMAQGAGPKALAALKEAQKYTGTPYRWGGSTPETGFDCSGLVQWAYAQTGIKIPRVTDDQIAATNGSAVPRAELLPGDLVFFRDAGGYVHHVGISMGGDKFLHAPHTGDVVKVSSLDEPYYKAQFTGGRRFDAAAAAAPAPVAAAPAAPAAPAVDPVEVAAAQAAVARDAAEARQANSGLFKAISAQEARKEAALGDRAVAAAGVDDEAAAGAAGDEAGRDSGLFLQAITADEAAKARADTDSATGPDASPPPAPAPAEPAPASPAAPAEPTPAGPPPDLSSVPADYPGDDAGQEALAKWLAKRAEQAGLPPELPVMAALVESGVKNLNFGDADSVGFFQMRVSIWNQGEYAGYPDDPGLQIKWFIDTALAHKKQQMAGGDADFGKDPATWGEWIADVERPAEQYRGRYQLRLAEARRLLR